MPNGTLAPDLSGRHVLIHGGSGGSGGVGEGAVRAYLAAGADVVVQARSQQRADEFRRLLGDADTGRLHLVVHDYTTFAGAEKTDGAYTIIVGESASTPVPASGLVSMEQAALLMMQRVLAAELGGEKRVFALVLGPVRTRGSGDGAPYQVTSDQVGAVAVAASASAVDSRAIRLRDQAELGQALALLQGTQPRRTGPVVAVSTLEPKNGQRDELLALLAELAPQIRAEPGCLRYSVHSAHGDDQGPLLVIQMFTSIEAFTAHSSAIAVQIPRLSALLETPPAPPALFGPVPSGGDPARESLSA